MNGPNVAYFSVEPYSLCRPTFMNAYDDTHVTFQFLLHFSTLFLLCFAFCFTFLRLPKTPQFGRSWTSLVPFSQRWGLGKDGWLTPGFSLTQLVGIKEFSKRDITIAKEFGGSPRFTLTEDPITDVCRKKRMEKRMDLLSWSKYTCSTFKW